MKSVVTAILAAVIVSVLTCSTVLGLTLGKLAATLSLMLWFGVGLAGRAIGFL